MSSRLASAYVKQAIRLAVAKPFMQSPTMDGLRDYVEAAQVPLAAARDAMAYRMTSMDVAKLLYAIGYYEGEGFHRREAAFYLLNSARAYRRLGHPLLAKLVLRALGTLFIYLGSPRKAERCLRRAADALAQLPASGVALGATLTSLAMILMRTSRLDEAERVLRDASTALEADSPIKDKGAVALSISSLLAEVHRQRGRYYEAERLASVGSATLELSHTYALICRERGHIDDSITRQQSDCQRCRDIYGDRHPVYAMLLSDLGEALAASGRFDEALAKYTESLRVQRLAAAGEHLGIARVLHNRASLFVQLGRHGDAVLDLAESTNSLNQHGEEHVLLGNIGLLMSSIHLARRQPTAAIAELQKAKRLFERLLSPDHPTSATIDSHLAQAHQMLRQYGEAAALHIRVLRFRARHLGKQHPDYMETINRYAVFLADRGELRKAELLFRRSVQGTRLIWGARHFLFANRLRNLGILLLRLNRLPQARGVLLRAENILAPHHLRNDEFVQVAVALARVFALLGKPLQSLPRIREAVSILLSANGIADDHTLIAIQLQVEFLKQAGRPKRASMVLESTIKRLEKAAGPESPAIPGLLNSLGDAYLAAKSTRRALSSYQHALCRMRRQKQHTDAEAAVVAAKIRDCLFRLGRFQQAIRVAQVICRVDESNFGTNHRSLAESLNALGVIQWRAGDRINAILTTTRALNIAREALGDKHQWTRQIAATLQSMSISPQ